MNSPVFYNRIVKHELYSCSSNYSKNVYQQPKLTRFTVTITPRQSSFSRLVVLLAVLQIILNKRATVKFLTVDGTKKICAFSQNFKFSKSLALKDDLFNFVYFRQQRLNNIKHDKDLTLFLNIHALMFSVFSQYYRFVFNVPRLRISFQTNTTLSTLGMKILCRFLRLPI
jgi:hypothetical protein